MTIEKNAARIILPGEREYSCNVITDTMGDKSIDITNLRKDTGYITYDPGYVNTGSCTSSICYINGEKGISKIKHLIYLKIHTISSDWFCFIKPFGGNR